MEIHYRVAKNGKKKLRGEPPDKERVASAKAQSSVYDESR